MTKAKRDQAWVKICEEVQKAINSPDERRERPHEPALLQANRSTVLEQEASNQQVKATMPPATRKRVFISYSHDSVEHTQRVRALADRLRADGAEAWIDQYVQDPEEGWITFDLEQA